MAAAGSRIDLLVNNASVLGPSPQPALADYPLDVLERVYRVNVLAPLALFQDRLPALAPGAACVNVTSDAAVEAYEGWGGYGSSKAALEQLTRVLAAEHPGAADRRRRPRRHEHADAPGGVPGRGHLRPPAARGERARACSRSTATRRAGATTSGGGRRMSAALAFELPAPGGRRAAGRARPGAMLVASRRRHPPRGLPRPPRPARARRPAGRQHVGDPPGGAPGGRRASPLDAAPRDGRRRPWPEDERWWSSCAKARRSIAAAGPASGWRLPGGGQAELLAPYLGGRPAVGGAAAAPEPLLAYLAGMASRSATATCAAAAAGRLPDHLRVRAGQRRDAERGPAVQRARALRLEDRGISGGDDRPPHRRVVARARRGAVSRAVPRADRDGGGQPR